MNYAKLSFSQIFNNLMQYKVFLFFLIHSTFLIIAWHSQNTVFIVSFAFIPVFYYLDFIPKAYNEKVKIYIFSYLSVFFWIYFTIYWIKPISSKSHFTTTIIATALLFIPYLLAFIYRFRFKKSSTYSKLIFIAVWISIEICHDINILGFPYLNLGHILAAYPNIIQWYSFTGSIGGTFWILIINLSLYTLIKNFAKYNNIKLSFMIKRIFVIITIISIPLLLSFFIKNNPQKSIETSYNVICVHTSTDVYNYKYEIEPETLLMDYLAITFKHLDSTQQNLIVWPENALTGEILFSIPDSSTIISTIKQELCNNPNNLLISGAIVNEIIAPPDSNSFIPPNILYDADKQFYFKRYNAALFIRSYEPTLIKTKKRLVPFGEKLPRQKVFSPIISLFPNLANLNFSSKKEEYVMFSIQNENIRTNPIICYGSAFSDFVADEILKTSSNLLTIIMNEGWMKSKKAYNHFYWFSVCRTIENQRQLVKSSNEGISAVINRNGKIEKFVNGFEANVVVSKIYVNNKFTFFTKHHSKIHFGILIIVLMVVLFCFLLKKKAH